MPGTPRHTRSTPPLRAPSLALKLACAALLLGGAAQARHDACGPAERAGSSCIDAPDVIAAGTAHEAPLVLATASTESPLTAAPKRAAWSPARTIDAARPVVVAPVPTEFDVKAAPNSSDPSMLGLLIAALGVVGFVAHRRGGR